MKFRRKKPSKRSNREISWGTPKPYQGGGSKKSFRKMFKDEIITNE